MDAERIDKWLYCARFAKTRTAAQELCNGGHVVLNGDKHFKVSRDVRAGDEIIVTRGGVRFHVRVTGFSDRRLGASAAQALYENMEEPQNLAPPAPLVFERRESHAGRPTKKDRRLINKLKGRT